MQTPNSESVFCRLFLRIVVQMPVLGATDRNEERLVNFEIPLPGGEGTLADLRERLEGWDSCAYIGRAGLSNHCGHPVLGAKIYLAVRQPDGVYKIDENSWNPFRDILEGRGLLVASGKGAREQVGAQRP